MLSFPELYALNRSTGLTRGNPLKGTSSTYFVCVRVLGDQKQGAELDQTPCTCRDPCEACKRKVPVENQELSESEDSDDENTHLDHSIKQQNEAGEVLAGNQILQEGMNCYYNDRNADG